MPDRDLPLPSPTGGVGPGGQVEPVDLARACRLVFDAARRSRAPGETLQDALLRVLYSTSPEEVRAGVASAWVRGDAECRGVTEAESLLRVADRLFH